MAKHAHPEPAVGLIYVYDGHPVGAAWNRSRITRATKISDDRWELDLVDVKTGSINRGHDYFPAHGHVSFEEPTAEEKELLNAGVPTQEARQ